jgi:RNA polymerase sigma-70 factor (ECF subfamily)
MNKRVLSTAVTDDEKVLLEQLREGNAVAFTKLYNAYSGQMYVNIFKMVKDEQTSEEIVQEIFSRIWQKRDSLQIEKSFAGYLYRVGQNLVHDFYQKLQRDKQLYREFSTTATEKYTHIEEALHYRESEALLQQAMGALSPQQKKMYQLCKLEGRSYKEAGALLGISTFTVKEHLVKASRFIRNQLNDKTNKALGISALIISRIIS